MMQKMIYHSVILVGILTCLYFMQPVHARGHQMTYEKLQKMGLSCYPNDTCSDRTTEDILSWNRCQCGAWCIRADSCCIDSPNLAAVGTKKLHPLATCQLVHSNKHLKIYMVSKCPSRWAGSARTKSKCEAKYEENDDLMGHAPVTSTKTQFTYANYYCALCNDDSDNFEMWDIAVRDPDDMKIPGASLDSLEFNGRLRRWEHISRSGGREHAVIVYIVPKRMDKQVQLCVKDLVSDCHPSWKGDMVRKMCRAYMSIVYVNPENTISNDVKRYRNVYCAVCNFEEIKKKDLCKVIRTSIYVDTLTQGEQSANILLDIRLQDGDQVGIINRCQREQFYDPQFRRCRRLMKCSSSQQVYRNGRCLRRRT